MPRTKKERALDMLWLQLVRRKPMMEELLDIIRFRPYLRERAFLYAMRRKPTNEWLLRAASWFLSTPSESKIELFVTRALLRRDMNVQELQELLSFVPCRDEAGRRLLNAPRGALISVMDKVPALRQEAWNRFRTLYPTLDDCCNCISHVSSFRREAIKIFWKVYKEHGGNADALIELANVAPSQSSRVWQELQRASALNTRVLLTVIEKVPELRHEAWRELRLLRPTKNILLFIIEEIDDASILRKKAAALLLERYPNDKTALLRIIEHVPSLRNSAWGRLRTFRLTLEELRDVKEIPAFRDRAQQRILRLPLDKKTILRYIKKIG